ncbi:TetR/AcrR family transcriptional regulator [Paenibacillus sp. sgz500958]|uniref:TetR/AcrR family transcriptional regulator n=1 Tax=Paenibacillus sp. sgz500958 TaxID=3242475 RepID=UPI0036D2C155
MIVNELDPRVIRSKQLIKDAFTQLIMERDFDSITVKDITERATINRATFYAHYEDKYILLETLFVELFDQILAGQNIDTSAFQPETLEKLIIAACEFLIQVKKGCKKISSSVMSLMEEKIISRLAAFISMILLNRADGNSLSEEIELTITMISWSVYGAALQWHKKQTITPEELARQGASLLRHGSDKICFVNSITS